MYQDVLSALDRKSALEQEISAANAEIERIKAWGNFSPDEVTALKDAGYDLHFYRLGRNEYQIAVQDPEIRLIRLASIDKMHTVAVLGSLPPTIPATEFTLPEKGMDALVAEIEQCRQEIITCEETLKKASIYDASFQVQMLKAKMRKTTLLPAKHQSMTKILYGFPVISRKQIFRNSRPQPRSINGPGPWMM